ncbi:uncharacterized protein LY79DRAFT_188156 [Colletotrichum navitas]|uniref:Uncharacterized protein n=1 Tax=Colletotrichum navitas TaxID=681940 RepID=A0AAD8PZS2_9PEZI|nr:uncharacterized protein LY79DRAFT_188156 [Colletotrichum navitas]KAK1593122.1 hypothetical protein LY79DRAFT_188156 [Colletotrichum navitas]
MTYFGSPWAELFPSGPVPRCENGFVWLGSGRPEPGSGDRGPSPAGAPPWVVSEGRIGTSVCQLAVGNPRKVSVPRGGRAAVPLRPDRATSWVNRGRTAPLGLSAHLSCYEPDQEGFHWYHPSLDAHMTYRLLSSPHLWVLGGADWVFGVAMRELSVSPLNRRIVREGAGWCSTQGLFCSRPQVCRVQTSSIVSRTSSTIRYSASKIGALCHLSQCRSYISSTLCTGPDLSLNAITKLSPFPTGPV